MCINPGVLRSGQQVPCHVCWQCRSVRANDWTGRCIAESKANASTFRLTLTYGKDDHYKVDLPSAHVLTYSDVQLYLKRLRTATGMAARGARLGDSPSSATGTVRFMATGEYGSLKGRAHWHLIVFFKDLLCPNLRVQERYVHSDGHNPLWPHGFSYWENLDDIDAMSQAAAMRYVTKYILKDQGTGFRAEHRYSTRPPLGYAYFNWLAAQYVRQGLAPQDLLYRFPGIDYSYRLSRASAFYYLDSFVQWWEATHCGRHDWPQSDLIDEFMDERERRLRRRAGVADYEDVDFDRRMDLYRKERTGEWLVGIGAAGDNKMFFPPSVDILNRHEDVRRKG